MLKAIALSCVLLLSGCANAQVAPPPAAASAEHRIAMQTNSWGRLISEWEVRGDGSVSYSTTEAVEGAGFFDYDVLTRRAMPGPEAYARVKELLRIAERQVGRDLPCDQNITDGQYGTVRWQEGQQRELPFNYGCMSAQANAIYTAMGQAQDLVEGWTANAEPERRQVRRQNR